MKSYRLRFLSTEELRAEAEHLLRRYILVKFNPMHGAGEDIRDIYLALSVVNNELALRGELTTEIR